MNSPNLERVDPEAERFSEFPGSELVVPGLADLRAGRESVEGLAVLCAADRLRSAGVDVPHLELTQPASHRLYELIASTKPDGAHSRFNALRGRIVSFARTLERAG